MTTMRDYLFRGKRVDNGEWVYGNFVKGCVDDFAYIVEFGNKNLCRNFVEVIPETVGQYTGLTDKNGKKIFEGDIVSRYVNRLDKRVNASVKNNTTVASWICEFFLYKDKKEVFLANRVGKNDCYIIGNIYDNPELLKGGDGNDGAGSG